MTVTATKVKGGAEAKTTFLVSRSGYVEAVQSCGDILSI